MAKYTFVYPPTLPWEFLHQRPQQLAVALGKLGHKFYFAQHPQDTSAETRISSVKGALNVFIINKDFEQFLDENRDCVILASWARYHYLKKAHPKCKMLVYDCLDNFPDWAEDENEMFKQADVVLASSLNNFDRARLKSAAKCHLVFNAADRSAFGGIPKADKVKDPFPKVPKHIRAIFTGCIGAWVDEDLVVDAAKLRRDIQYIFVGPCWNARAKLLFEQEPNIYMFPEVPHADLKKLFYHSDVGILPFRKQDQVTEAADPIKVWEYLAAGMPVVATSISEMRKFGDHVRVKDGPYFASAISQEYTNNTADKQKARMSFMELNSWKHRAHAIEMAVDNFTKG